MITQIHFNPDGVYNGQPSWISDDSIYKIIWDNSVNKWKLSGGTLGYSIYNSTPTYPPLSGWYILGGSGSVETYEGSCESLDPINLRFTVNQPSCLCDGMITFNVNGDNPPFLYSINGGITYSNSPIFTDLCSGTYSLKVQDSLFNIVSDTAIVNSLQPIVQYQVVYNTTSTILVNTSTTKTVQEVTTISVNPPLPPGVTITFNFNHLNSFDRSPNSGSGILTTNTILEKNSVPIVVSLVNNTTTTTFNNLPGCQNQTKYVDIIDEQWNNLTIQNGDNYIVNTITTVQQHCFDPCCFAESSETYYLQTINISGCECCQIYTTSLYE